MSIQSIFRFSCAIVLSLALLAASPALAEVALAPGETASDVAADASTSKCDPENCQVSFDLPSSTLLLEAMSVDGAEAEASATLLSSFAITADGTDPSDETPLLGSSLSLTVDANGILEIDGDDSLAAYRLDVLVTDVATNAPIGSAKVADGATVGGSEVVNVSEVEVLNLNLIRGHRYQVALTLSVFTSAGAIGSATANFGNSSASWEGLTIVAGADVLGGIGDLEARVDELEEDVDQLQVDVVQLQGDVVVLEEDVDQLQVDVVQLEEDVAELGGDLEDLEDEFESHTHEYLTGRGTGHNNTTATTSVPDDSDGPSIDPIDEDDDVSIDDDEEDDSPGNSGKKGKKDKGPFSFWKMLTGR